MNRFCIMACFILGLIGSELPLFAAGDQPLPPKKFHPTQIEHLEFFIESIKGMVIAKNTSEEAYNNTKELTPTDKVWSDQKRFPHGTVRWWLDQSSQGKPTKRSNKPFKTGRSFGQDDHDRPGYIPDGCNGKPCARGGLVPPGEQDKHSFHYKQPCYFELQPEDRFRFEGPFSLFLLVKPVQQQKNFAYFGVFHWSMLTHQIKDNSLRFKNGRYVTLTGANAVDIGKWQLIEVHRNQQNQLRCIVNGSERTLGTPAVDGPFRFTHLMNNNKNIWKKADPFTGDLAAFALYSEQLSKINVQAVRDYFDAVYNFKPGSAKK